MATGTFKKNNLMLKIVYVARAMVTSDIGTSDVRPVVCMYVDSMLACCHR